MIFVDKDFKLKLFGDLGSMTGINIGMDKGRFYIESYGSFAVDYVIFEC